MNPKILAGCLALIATTAGGSALAAHAPGFFWSTRFLGSSLDFVLPHARCQGLPVTCESELQFPVVSRNIFGVTAGDVDGDGVQEIVALAENPAEFRALFFLNLGNIAEIDPNLAGLQVPFFSHDQIGFAMKIAAGDVSGDQHGEIVVAVDNQMLFLKLAASSPEKVTCDGINGCGGYDQLIS
jgi:hypothetical protein